MDVVKYSTCKYSWVQYLQVPSSTVPTSTPKGPIFDKFLHTCHLIRPGRCRQQSNFNRTQLSRGLCHAVSHLPDLSNKLRLSLQRAFQSSRQSYTCSQDKEGADSSQLNQIYCIEHTPTGKVRSSWKWKLWRVYPHPTFINSGITGLYKTGNSVNTSHTSCCFESRVYWGVQTSVM